ncbi:hypothetical protein [Streptomyces cinnamoneus]|uniref:hypothetical protein n=1 Tax=Streptomyces cinnamoneus TaxID=53446 RepID=UPI0015E324B4|nr:hypothetical protein [Streptomyces cinnamoneus]
MPKLKSALTAGQALGGAARALPLPDLAGVGLRALRETADPGLAAAVDHVLRCPGALAEAWDAGNEGGVVEPCTGR